MSRPGQRARFGRSNLLLMLACLALAGAMLWGAGLFDGAIAKDVRVSNVYVEPGVPIDEEEAERIIGNRHLVVVYLDGPMDGRGSDLCDDLRGPAAGSFVAILDGDLDMYGCSLLPGADDDDFGKAYTSELVMQYGIKMVADDPIQSARVLASTFDRLVAAGLAPQEARAITPPLGRYIVAAIAGGSVVLGSLLIYARGRRLGHRLADSVESDAALAGKVARRDNALAAAGVRLLAVDERAERIAAIAGDRRSARDRRFLHLYRRLTKSYLDLNAVAVDTPITHTAVDDQLEQAERLVARMTPLLPDATSDGSADE